MTVISHLFKDLCSSPLEIQPQVIFFDAMGTLFGLQKTVGEIYGDRAQSFGVTVNPEQLNRAFFQVFKMAPPLAFPESDAVTLARLEFNWWRAIAAQSFDQIGALGLFKDFDLYFEELYQYFATKEPWFIYEDVIPTLDYWQKKGVKLGVISNFDSRLTQILRLLDLEKYFTKIIFSSNCAIAKPDPQIFYLALEKYGILPAQAWHIGDSLKEDYQGAKMAGLTAFLIER
ncbi:MAG: HAD-IA family hydrolase [Microcystaceae cyanobacterium]